MKTNHSNVGRDPFPTNAWKQGIFMVMAFCMLYGIGAGRVDASCIALDDVPLDTQEQQAPGIVMFVIDDSGSMDWEYICQGSADGKFRGNIEYLFADPGDNAYSSGDSNGTVLETYNNGEYKNYWQSQWAGHNRLYYDPGAYYAPWPTFTDANPNTPRSNPSVAGNTLDLSAVYHDFGEPLMSTAALVNAGAVFVDNLDTADDQGIIIAPEIIMDNVASVNDILWNGQNYGSFSTSGQAWLSATATNAFPDASYPINNNNYLYTNTRSRTYQATWSFTNITPGDYDVYAWWVGGASYATAVTYTINGTTTATVNQENNGGQWRLLSANQYFNGSGTVVLNHNNPNNNNNRACADAVKLVPKFNAVPDILFEKTGPLSPPAYPNEGWQLNYDANAYKRPQDPGTNGTYYFTNAVGTFTATWTANNLIPGQRYDVYAVWAQGGSNRSNAVPYVTYHSGGTQTTTVDQQQTLGHWTKIAGGATGITFTGGIGRVVLNRTTTSATSGRACADAVAFVPHGTISIKINRAHYYTETPSGRYLVNIDGGSIVYYKYTDNGDNVVQGNELQRLITSAEIAAAGIDTAGRTTYTQERQNFANWYSFYRKRELTAKNAVSKVINDMQGVYIGIHCINAGLRSIARPVRVTLNKVLNDESSSVMSTVFAINSSGNTPLRNGLKNMGNYFKGLYGKPSPLPSTNFSSDSYPYFTADKGGTCQQSFAIVMTDGYWNGPNPEVGNADLNTANPYDGPPYEDAYSNTLADVAMYFYKNDLNSNLNDDVPINSRDLADHQHLVTYTLSFGVDGTIDQSAYPECVNGGLCPSPWPDAFAGNAQKIDDMYHAAVNGRGKYVNAASPQEMVNAMNELKQDIESRLGSAAALATNSIQRQVGTVIYQGTYNTAGWFGEVKALPVNVETGAIGAELWRASNHVPSWNTRNILSYNGTSGIVFEFNNISEAQETLLENNGHDPGLLVDFIRGDRSHNASNGGPFRVRTQPIGDIVHSAPAYYKGVVYIGANDGMLHAIDAANGHELFCYVPGMVYGHLSDLALPGYSHRYYVDGTPTVGRVNGKDILVCGLGKGGKGVFALDVTNPNSMAPDAVLWEYTGDDDLGYSFSEVNIVSTQAGRAVIFGNGYDSVNQKAILYALNPETGAVIRKLDTESGSCNGLSTPKVVDVNGDGYADFAFAGDLKGNMWKFDLRGPAADWKVYFSGSVPKPLISAFNVDGYIQPITAAPEVMLDCAKSGFANGGNGLMVIFGTGRYLNSDDFGDFSKQSLYGVWDWSDIWETRDGYDVAKTKYLGELQTDRSLNNVSGTTLQEQTVVSTSGHWLTLSDNTVDWYNPDDTTNPGSHMGWVFDLPQSGERGIREPSLRMGVAIFVSVIPSSSPCEAGGSSVVYQVSACSGGRTDDPQFDVNGDGKIDDNDLVDGLPPTGLEFEQMLFEPIEIGDQLYFPDSGGNINEMAVPPNLMGMQFWRVIQ